MPPSNGAPCAAAACDWPSIRRRRCWRPAGEWARRSRPPHRTQTRRGQPHRDVQQGQRLGLRLPGAVHDHQPHRRGGERLAAASSACPSSAKLGSFWDANVTTPAATATAKNRGYTPTIAAGATPRSASSSPAAARRPAARSTARPVPADRGPRRPRRRRPRRPNRHRRRRRPPHRRPSRPPRRRRPPLHAGSDVAGRAVRRHGSALERRDHPRSLGSSGIKSFSLAFVTSVGCKASWFNAFDPRQKQFADQIAAVRAAGGDVKVSFGGATGIELAQACTSVVRAAGRVPGGRLGVQPEVHRPGHRGRGRGRPDHDRPPLAARSPRCRRPTRA